MKLNYPPECPNNAGLNHERRKRTGSRSRTKKSVEILSDTGWWRHKAACKRIDRTARNGHRPATANLSTRPPRTRWIAAVRREKLNFGGARIGRLPKTPAAPPKCRRNSGRL